MLKNTIQIALVFYVVLLLIIWCTPMAFAAVEINSFKSDLAYAITNSGGKYYVFVIAAATSLIFAFRNKVNNNILITFLKQFVILFLMLAFFASLNEFLVKDIAKFARPSHAFIFKHTKHMITIDQFYKLPVPKRQTLVKELVKTSPYLNERIDSKVLEHWIEEAGYSFPSGHSFNAFLIATVLAFSIKQSRKLQLNKYFILPFVWATTIGISRVALGVHNPIDVTFGAALGIFFGSLLLYFETTRHIILHRHH